MVASAHGDLQSLLKNPELNSMVGGTTTVTVGDVMAARTNGGNKVRVTTLTVSLREVEVPRDLEPVAVLLSFEPGGTVPIGRRGPVALSSVRSETFRATAVILGKLHSVDLCSVRSEPGSLHPAHRSTYVQIVSADGTPTCRLRRFISIVCAAG